MSLVASQTPRAASYREKAIQEAEIARAGMNVDKATEAENIALKAYEKVVDNPKITDEGIIQSEEYKAYTEAGDRVLAAEERLMELDPGAQTHKRILARRRESGEQREAVEKARTDAKERLALEQERISSTPKLSTCESMPDTWSSMPDTWGSMPNVWDQTYTKIGGK
jgi:hypothetical protein